MTRTGVLGNPTVAVGLGLVLAQTSGVGRVLETAVTVGTILWLQKVYVKEGKKGILRVIAQTLRMLPGANLLLKAALKSEVKGAMKTLVKNEGQGDQSTGQTVLEIPAKGIPKEDLLKEMETDRNGDGTYCQDGKAFALVYFNEEGRFAQHVEMNTEIFEKLYPADAPAEQKDLMKKVFRQFMHGNALNPLIFPALRKYETECVSMVGWMLHGSEQTVGAMTSGGTESILMAIKTFREMAHENLPHITEPEVIAPITIHPAHEKAGHYFGVKIVHCGVDPITKRADVKELESLIGPNTIGIAASAPQYCHCVVDPIEEIGAIAEKHGLPFHVDACYGGFILPWIEKLGYDVPVFDFRVPGVTSISADIHKYGFAPKGASFILFKNEEVRKYMYYAYSAWPGGLYVSPSMAGTRPGANIAMAWATLKSIGQDGYLEEAKSVMETTQAMKDGIKGTPGLRLVVDVPMTGFAVESTEPGLHIFTVADEMEKLGWRMERQSNPDSLHCSIMPSHANKHVAEQFVQDMRKCVETVRSAGANVEAGTAAIYGMVGQIPDQTIVEDFLKGFFSEIYKTR